MSVRIHQIPIGDGLPRTFGRVILFFGCRAEEQFLQLEKHRPMFRSRRGEREALESEEFVQSCFPSFGVARSFDLRSVEATHAHGADLSARSAFSSLQITS